MKPSPHVNIAKSKYIIKLKKKLGMYSQFLQIGEVLEDIGWKLSDVVHAQVTVKMKKEKKKNNQYKTVTGGAQLS